MKTQKIALILGATGGIGGEVAGVLQRRGWHIRALHRKPDSVAQPNDGYEWVQGDAMNEADVVQAASGASLIVHAVNPPGYRNWAQLVLPMLDNTIRAARASGARIVLPGTVYNYGPDTWPELLEDSPQRPVTRKGRIRADMEARLRAASGDGVRTLIVRAGDFFGPGAANNWFSQGLVKPGKAVTTILQPGQRGVGHQWAYLPDVAETMVRLIECEAQLEPFAMFHMNGHWDAEGTAMAAAIQRAVVEHRGVGERVDEGESVGSGAGNGIDKGPRKHADNAAAEHANKHANKHADKRTTTQEQATPTQRVSRPPRIRAFPWALVMLASPFVPLFREMREMRYLWREPLRMRNTQLVRLVGAEPHTPLDDAVRATLEGIGCLPESSAPGTSVHVRHGMPLAL